MAIMKYSPEPEREADDQIKIKYQDKSYNEDYKNWRRQNRGVHGFYYAKNPNELTWQDGLGFIKDYPEIAEANALGHVLSMIGAALLAVLVSDMAGTYLFPMVLNRLGADIVRDGYTGRFYGNDWIIIANFFFTHVIIRIIILAVCQAAVKMPIRLTVPLKIAHKPLFKISVPFALLISGTGYAAALIFRRFLARFGVSLDRNIWLPEEPAPLLAALIVFVILIPLIAEISLRGFCMHLLRQFGDGEALLFVSFITAALTYNWSLSPFIFIIAFISGFFMIRTGSVLSAVLIRVTYCAFYYSAYLLETRLDPDYASITVNIFTVVCILSGLYATVSFVLKNSDSLSIPVKSRYMTFDRKIAEAVSRPTILIWLTLTVIIFIIRIGN